MLVFFSINIYILNVRLGGETDQQNVIMHKAYCSSQNECEILLQKSVHRVECDSPGLEFWFPNDFLPKVSFFQGFLYPAMNGDKRVTAHQ